MTALALKQVIEELLALQQLELWIHHGKLLILPEYEVFWMNRRSKFVKDEIKTFPKNYECRRSQTGRRAMTWITPSMGTPSLSPILSPSHVVHPPLSEHKPFGDLRPHLSGAVAEPPSFTGYEPKQLAENQDHRHFTEDKQLTDNEELRVKPLSFHQPITASTHDSAESIATPLGLGLRR